MQGGNEMLLKRLTPTGIAQFARFIRMGNPVTPTLGQFEAKSLNVAIDIDEQQKFTSRYQLAIYLVKQLAPLGSRDVLVNDHGIWTALSVILHDLVRPLLADGSRGARKDEVYYVATTEYSQRYLTLYRHLIREAWFLASKHGEVAKYLLSSPPQIMPNIFEVLCSKKDFRSNRALVAVAETLYFDRESDELKSGLTDLDAGGTPRRFTRVMDQFACTYDMATISAEIFYHLLPDEFDRWKGPESG